MYIVILITVSRRQEAQRIAKALVGKKIAACVNAVPGVASIFFWKGRVERARETLLVVKTRKEKLSRLIKLVTGLHSYEVPEIIALPIVGGHKPYLRWIDESVR